MKKPISILIVMGLLSLACCKEQPKDQPKEPDNTAVAEVSYKSEAGDVAKITYSDDRKVIKIARDGKPTLSLDQKEAWAKGADYEKDGVLWHAQGDTGTLTEKGVVTKFTEVK